ncbi:MAG: response regulator [Planctomycetota bacterium]
MTRPRMSVLLIEDDLAFAEQIRLALSESALQPRLVAVQSAEEAWRVLRGQDPQRSIERPFVLLLDLHLPGAGGVHFLDDLRHDPVYCDTVVLVLSGAESQEAVEEVYERNVAGYVRKATFSADSSCLVELLEHFEGKVVLPGEELE